MPELDLHGFVTPPDTFQGLYHAADKLQQVNYHNQLIKKAADNRKLATDKFLQGYYDPNKLHTGTVYDPVITDKVLDLKNQAFEMASKGLDATDITVALSPQMEDISTYSSKAKVINQNNNEFLKQIKGVKGYNPEAMNNVMQEQAFYNIDPTTGKKTLKDIHSIDETKNYGLDALQNNPEKVTTDEGVDFFAKNFPRTGRTEKVVTTDDYGNKTEHTVKGIAANWEVAEKGEDGKLRYVPKYTIAADNKQPITHDFISDDGKTTINAPIRLLADDVFNNAMAIPNVADRIKGLTKQHIAEYKDDKGQPITLDDPRALTVAKAVAYTALKDKTNSVISSTDSRVLSAPTIRKNYTGRPYSDYVGPRAGGKVGNPLDEIPNGDWGNGVKVYNGRFFDTKGNSYSGFVPVKYEDLPASVYTSLNTLKVDLNKKEPIYLTIDNGKIKHIQQKGKPPITNEMIQNGYVATDKEALKSSQHFQVQGQGQKTTTNKNPLGLKL